MFYPSAHAPGQRTGTSSRDVIFALAAFFIPVLVSLPLLSSDLLGGEYAEMVLGATTLGIVRFPGYPLYLLSAKLVTLILPWTIELWAINFASLLFGAGCASVLFLLGRGLQFPAWVSLSGAWMFFFSPFFWQQSLVARPFTFHFLLLSGALLLTVRLLAGGTSRVGPLALFFWALLCGLSGGQQFSLLPWSLTAFGLGLALGFPPHRTRGMDYSLALIGFLVGLVVPYLYLPLRVLALNAFIHPEAMQQYAGLRYNPSPSGLVAWLLFYLETGFRDIFFFRGVGSSVFHLQQTFSHFIRQTPLLSLVMMLVGFFLYAREALVRQPSRLSGDADIRLRLVLALIPVLALFWQLILTPARFNAGLLSLTLAASLWGLRGLEYGFYELGQVMSPAKKSQRPRPAGFGWLLIGLVPLFALLQSHATLQQQVRQPAMASSTLNQAQRFLRRFPPYAVITSVSAETSHTLMYVQDRLTCRPDLRLIPFSQLWPGAPYPAPSQPQYPWHGPLPVIPQPLRFAEYWTSQLSKMLAQGVPVFFLSQPAVPTEALTFFLQSFSLTPEEATLPEWCRPATQRRLTLFRIQPLPAASVFPVAPNEPALAEYGERLRLLAVHLPQPVQKHLQCSLLKFSLRWQDLRPRPGEPNLVRIWIAPAQGDPALRRLDARKLLWTETRLLGARVDWEKLPPRWGFTETYQIPVPTPLPVGRYRINLGVLNAQSNDWLSPNLTHKPDDHFVAVGEFWILPSKETGRSSAPPLKP